MSTYVRVKEVADHFRVTKATVYKWISEGRIEATRLGRVVLITTEEFNRLKSEGLRPIREDQESRTPSLVPA